MEISCGLSTQISKNTSVKGILLVTDHFEIGFKQIHKHVHFHLQKPAHLPSLVFVANPTPPTKATTKTQTPARGKKPLSYKTSVQDKHLV